MDSSEELVTLIQHGETDRLAELWEQVCRFVRQQAIRRARQLDGWGGVTSEDLYQSGYIALVGAVQTYQGGRGKTFLGWLDFYLRREFASAAGYLTERQRRDPLSSADSLDRPLDAEDAEGDTLAELVPDPFDHAEALAEADERAWRTRTLRAAVDRLPEDQRQTLRLRYWEGKTLQQTAEAMGYTSPEQPRKLEHRALQTLSKKTELREMRLYLDQRTNFFRGGADPVTANILRREELEQNWRKRHESPDFTHTGGTGRGKQADCAHSENL